MNFPSKAQGASVVLGYGSLNGIFTTGSSSSQHQTLTYPVVKNEKRFIGNSKLTGTGYRLRTRTYYDRAIIVAVRDLISLTNCVLKQQFNFTHIVKTSELTCVFFTDS